MIRVRKVHAPTGWVFYYTLQDGKVIRTECDTSENAYDEGWDAELVEYVDQSDSC